MSELVMVIEGPEKDLCDIWRLVFENFHKWPNCGFITETIDLKMTSRELLQVLDDENRE